MSEVSEENFEESFSQEKFDVFYKCMRCGHETALELSLIHI